MERFNLSISICFHFHFHWKVGDCLGQFDVFSFDSSHSADSFNGGDWVEACRIKTIKRREAEGKTCCKLIGSKGVNTERGEGCREGPLNHQSAQSAHLTPCHDLEFCLSVKTHHQNPTPSKDVFLDKSLHLCSHASPAHSNRCRFSLR